MMLRVVSAHASRLALLNLRQSHPPPRLHNVYSKVFSLSVGVGRQTRRAYSNTPRQSVFPQSALSICPSCSQPLPTPLPVCPACEHIEPIPSGMSYHQIMGFDYEPNPFQVDHATLRARFLAIQRLVHPDRWAAKSPVRCTTAFFFMY